jgi:hypothetical protein
MGDRDQALPFYEKARAIAKELYGDDYMDCYEFRVLDAVLNK